MTTSPNYTFILNECPVRKPATKRTNATAPRKKIVSPGTRIQRTFCIIGDCQKSPLRAYQYPRSTETQVCMSPTAHLLFFKIALIRFF